MKVLITGASSGIGEALAQVAALRNHDVVLVARRKERLEEISHKLETQYSINAEVIDADLTVEQQRNRVIVRLRQGDIDVLINNAGFGSSGPFSELDVDNELNEIDLNIRALVELTHVAVNEMIPKKRGTVANISSIASYQPMTGNATYGATKAFVTSFTHAIREELSESGVNVMMVCPGLTVTEFHERSRWSGVTKNDPVPQFMWQSSREVAEATFRGIDHHHGVVIPGIGNKFLAGISSSLPGSVTRKITAIVAKGRRLR